MCIFTISNVHGTAYVPQTYYLNAENLTDTYTINLSGIYIINCSLSDLNVSSNLICINANNVVIDGNNNWLNSTKDASDRIIYVNGQYATIKNIKSKGWSSGFWINDDDALITNNTLLELNSPIVINFAQNTKFSNNFVDNSSYCGVVIQSSSYTTVYNNTITNFATNGIQGSNSYYLNISHNTVINDSFSSGGVGSQGFGISLAGTHGSTIAYNTVKNNSFGGALYLNTGNSPEENYIYLNNFIDNIRDAKVDSFEGNIYHSPSAINYTYNGQQYSSVMGNYWDNCTNPADANGDGIRDGNYSVIIMGIQGNDTHPLVEKWENYFSSGSITPENTTNKSSIIHINNSSYNNNRTIVGPGTYILDEDITNITAGILVQSSDVVIDGNNHKLGTDSTALDVLQIYKSGKIYNNITIKNLVIETPLNYKCNGIMINSSVNNLTIENCNIIINNGTFGIGFNPNDAQNSLNSPVINNNIIMVKNNNTNVNGNNNAIGIGVKVGNYGIFNTTNNPNSKISNNNITIIGENSTVIRCNYSNIPMDNLKIDLNVLNNTGKIIRMNKFENAYIKDSNLYMHGNTNGSGIILYSETLKDLLINNTVFNATTNIYGICVYNTIVSDNITLSYNTFNGVDAPFVYAFMMIGPIQNSNIYLNDFLAGCMAAYNPLVNCTFESPNDIRYKYNVNDNVYINKFGNYWFNFNHSQAQENPVDNGKGFTTKPYVVGAFSDNYSRYTTLDNYVFNYAGNNTTKPSNNDNNNYYNNNHNSAKKMAEKAESEGTQNGFSSENIRNTVTNSKIIADDKFDKLNAENCLKENIQDSEDMEQELELNDLNALTEDVIVVGGPVVNKFAEKYNNKFLKPVNNENPGENRGLIQVLKVQDDSSQVVSSHYVIYIAGSDRYGTQAALEYFKTLNELPTEPIMVEWVDGGYKIVN
ncbi:NosD domain-containing protein [Methanococcus voltae]|uniref:NosD domain-containing protein n=1 Tax=Methanococcus voltae TaxID=2188 RepID=UPI000B26C976|nr:NosD domain-containing protein [Methanococcus voltae]MCS3901206.1 hypothetical protein [Methanococcus voltae]